MWFRKKADRPMKHEHIGPMHVACTGCFAELWADEKSETERAKRRNFLLAELRGRRFWAYVLVGFSLALAGVSAFVLWRVGMGR